jgi:hypothetical protein
MVENKDLANSFTFEIDLKVASGEEFKGTFTIHRPTIGERIRIGVTEAAELGGMVNIDPYTSSIAHMIATFDVIVDKAPIWWKPRDLRDLEVAQAVWDKYQDYLKEFQGKPQSQEAGKATSE